MKLLTASNPKLMKGTKKGYLSFILHLAPGKISGYQVCPKASEACLDVCLNLSGRGRFDKVQSARIRKTKMFFENREAFMDQLVKDIQAGIRKAERENLIPVFRLNGTSDIRWETVKVGQSKNIFARFPEIQFYDYTKLPNRKNIPENYHLTFSRSESNHSDCGEAFLNGMNVAVVFSEVPEMWNHIEVHNGDETDLRFLDPPSVFVGLKAKGKAKKDQSGFVVHLPTI